MEKYKFSPRSRENLKSCHFDLQQIMNVAIEISPIDFGIAEGHRTVEKQQAYFNADPPLTKIDGINQKSKHNYYPSLAADFYPVLNGKANYNYETLTYLAGVIHAVAEMLYRQGKISHKIRWGGNWDQDGEIITDQTFDDRPHVELFKPK